MVRAFFRRFSSDLTLRLRLGHMDRPERRRGHFFSSPIRPPPIT
jgi:hypothetical protein